MIVDATQDSTPSAAEQLPQIDNTLRMLVSIVNAVPGVSIGITLHLGGSVVSGQLVANTTYFHGVSAEMRSAGGEGQAIANSIADSFESLAGEAEKRRNDEDPARQPAFIHLKDARFLGGNDLVPNNRGVWWRGRLTEVGGFSIGQLS